MGEENNKKLNRLLQKLKLKFFIDALHDAKSMLNRGIQEITTLGQF